MGSTMLKGLSELYILRLRALDSDALSNGTEDGVASTSRSFFRDSFERIGSLSSFLCLHSGA